MLRFLIGAAMTMTTATRLLACDAALPDHVRIPDCRKAAAVADAAGRSATLNDLFQRVQRTNGLIFITTPPAIGRAKDILGGLSLDISVAGSFRILRIYVTCRLDDTAMAVVGHEVRHAVEVLETSATTEAEVDALYGRIGWPMSSLSFETQAAIDAQNTIAHELRASRTDHK